MSKVVLELSVSLDGFAAGPDDGPAAPLGIGGERLHEWMFAGQSASDSDTRETAHFSEVGALILGRRMADLGIGPWGEEPTYHAPCFVVTHRPAETIQKRGGTSYVFVTGGIEGALERAREAAGPQDVHVIGGADVAQQFVNAGLLDEIRLHLVPTILGAGARLFAGVRTDVRLVPREAQNHHAVTHLVYEVEGPTAGVQHDRRARPRPLTGRIPMSASHTRLDEVRLNPSTALFEGGPRAGVGVTMFIVRTPPGAFVGLHTHPYAETFVLLEGNGRWTAGDEVIEATAESIISVPAHSPHGFRNIGRKPLLVVSVHESPTLIQEFTDREPA